MKKLTLLEFISRAIKIHGNLYDYSKVIYIDYVTKVCIIDPEHGEFWITPSDHICGKGSRKRADVKNGNRCRSTKEQFIEKAIKVHKDLYGYELVNYIGGHEKVCIYDRSNKKYFWQTPASHLQGRGSPYRSINISKISLTWLLSIDPKQKFITPYIEPTLVINGKKRKVDGYDYQSNTVYQFHGSHWHGWNGKKIIDQPKYDHTLLMDQEIRDSGYNLIVMWQHDWKPTKIDISRVPEKLSDTENFIKRAIKIHQDRYDYTLTKYSGINNHILYRCKRTNIVFSQIAESHLAGHKSQLIVHL